MVDQEDLRKFERIDEFGEIAYKFPDKQQAYQGECLNISGCGLFFKAEQPIEMGKAIEVRSASLSALAPSMVAYVEVVRCKETPSGSYEIGVEIKGIKES